jgi:predicted metalloprotease with PDZ domain
MALRSRRSPSCCRSPSSFSYSDRNAVLKNVNGIRIEFTDESPKTADLITFSTTSPLGDATIRDVGTFTPGTEIAHNFRQYTSSNVWAPVNPPLTCAVQAVHFTDGTVWQQGAPSKEVDLLLGLALENDGSSVVVRFVAPGGAGFAAGLKQNDRIVSVGGNAVSSIRPRRKRRVETRAAILVERFEG